MIVVVPKENQKLVYGALQQLLATARIKPGDVESDNSNQYVSHGMLGR